jgi:hypothetical protein
MKAGQTDQTKRDIMAILIKSDLTAGETIQALSEIRDKVISLYHQPL